jgi:hypothetical protein
VPQKPTHSLPEQTEQYQHVLREVEGSRECTGVQPDFKSSEEREFYYEMLHAMEAEGRKSQAEMELLLNEALAEWRKYDE